MSGISLVYTGHPHAGVTLRFPPTAFLIALRRAVWLAGCLRGVPLAADKVLTRIAKHEGIQTLVDALRRNAPAGQRMSVDVPSESMMECGLTLIAGISGLDMPGPREPVLI